MTLIRPTRREILKLAAIAPGFALPAMARANLGVPAAANPGHFRFTLGEARLTVISDGFFTQPIETVGVNADRDAVANLLERHFLAPEANYAHTNHLLIELGDATVLVDVGSGSRFFPTTGRLMANMEAAGIDPGAITHVFITHAHPDHIWGIRDDFDEPIFPDAEYIIGEVEHGYWMQDGLANAVAPEDQQFVVGAVNSINAEGVEWTLVQDGAEIAPGISVMDSFGHTAGHMCLRVESGGKQLIALGDSFAQTWMNFAHPGWYNDIDADPGQTVSSREAILDMAAADEIALIGYHFPFPGVGHVARDGAGYRFVPALWQFTE
ncbi:MBL fold metallo-hydrolase [Marimonas arenosa]|uniref:MBL fold metallo-hydrolase n=1 Tax=Marimonas arenosa TaxID=1795305 RepID=A0AAE3WA83_9RHOB|nr:MBL fold metallo-hydrolase [Marimonas arenosa]MDQ2089431.1 MBL fold metallo-hydrolase [Marimonas arenosa]